MIMYYGRNPQAVEVSLDGVGVSGGTVNLKAPPVLTGWRLIVTRYSVENRTSNNSDLRVLTLSHGQEFIWEEQLNMVAANLYWGVDPIIVNEGHELVFRIAQSTDNDVLKAFYQGYLVRLEGLD